MVFTGSYFSEMYCTKYDHFLSIIISWVWSFLEYLSTTFTMIESTNRPIPLSTKIIWTLGKLQYKKVCAWSLLLFKIWLWDCLELQNFSVGFQKSPAMFRSCTLVGTSERPNWIPEGQRRARNFWRVHLTIDYCKENFSNNLIKLTCCSQFLQYYILEVLKGFIPIRRASLFEVPFEGTRT